METKNIMIVGVGGQGSLLASKLLGHLLMEQGYDVKVSEVHGMSQRGGSVVTYVRYGDRVNSPVIDKGEADYIVSFELLEAARWLSYLKPDGQIVTNTQQIDPMPVITGAAQYPENLVEKMKATGAKVDALDCLKLAEEAGSSKAVNIVLMGRLSHYFDLPEEVNAIVGDGRAWLTASDEQWDVIMVDAYQDITIPFQMSSVEFFTEVYEHLKPGGVMVVNMSMRSESEGSMNEYLMDTIKSVFPCAWTVRVSGGTNLELFATADEDALARFEERRSEVPDEYAAIMQLVDDGLETVEGGDYILTDDKAPVELLGMAVLDEIIANELEVLRGQIAENGIMSLLE